MEFATRGDQIDYVFTHFVHFVDSEIPGITLATGMAHVRPAAVALTIIEKYGDGLRKRDIETIRGLLCDMTSNEQVDHVMGFLEEFPGTLEKLWKYVDLLDALINQ
jgi:hypothetical protein